MHELQKYYMAKAEPGESQRSRFLSLLEAYYRGSDAYSGLPNSWDQCLDHHQNVIPFRLRRPSTVVPVAKLLVDTFNRALWASGRRPIATLKGADGVADNQTLSDLISEARLYKVMREATRRALTIGTGLVVWKIIDGRHVVESWDAKHATPTFVPGRFPLLQKLEYRYKYEREVEDSYGYRIGTFWHREVIDGESWTVYEPVEVQGDRAPVWTEDKAQSVTHGLGFVPAAWFTVGERQGSDGTGIFSSFLSLIDDLNYTASQAARALYYSLDPVTVLTGVEEHTGKSLERGGSATWRLEPGADAKLLESNGSYIAQSNERINALRKWILDAAAVVINDPEKIGGAQSAASLEILSAPMLAEIDDLREDVGNCGLVPVLQQMLAAKAGRSDWQSIPVGLHWGALHPSTPRDAKEATEAAQTAVALGAMSRAAAQRYIAPFVGVTDTEADKAQMEAERAELPARIETAKAIMGEGFQPSDLAWNINDLPAARGSQE